MKFLLTSILTAAAAYLALAAENPSIDGQWKVHLSIAGNDSDQTCTFVQKESELSGTCAGDQSSGNITGQINETKVKWQMKSQYNGGPITLNYDGQLNTADKKITGSIEIPEFSVTGDFTAVPAK